MNREQLIEKLARGERCTFVFFWGHAPKVTGVVDRSCLSQWYPAEFEVEGVSYRTAEHWMMAEKARLFRDEAVRAQIVAAETPAEAKALGRKVSPFEPGKWDAARFDAVVKGNVAKFSAHAELRRFLLGTGDAVLVEASPRDRIWGIGMGASNPEAQDPARWRGLNLLGFALMEARKILEHGKTGV